MAGRAGEGELVDWVAVSEKKPKALRGFWDGAYKASSEVASCGWILEGCFEVEKDGTSRWELVGRGGFRLPKFATITAAEMTGLSELIRAAVSYAECRNISFLDRRVQLNVNSV